MPHFVKSLRYIWEDSPRLSFKGILKMQSIFYELWRETGSLLSHLDKNQIDWVLGVIFAKIFIYGVENQFFKYFPTNR